MLSSRPISFNGDVDIPQSILNAKTPGRKALKGRIALQENAIHTGSKTVISKKNILQTPFRPGTAHGKKPLVSISVTRPLMDKTPFPNRVAAAAFGGAGPAGKTPGTKLSKLALLVSEPQQQQESLSPDVAPLLRPSSARKSLRGRLSGSTFKTPLTKGNYWDVSPGDMEGIGGVAEDAKEEAEAAVAEEDEEIEYMPPTAVELPYEPPFEMPDYKAMGRALFTLAHGGGLMDDAADVYYAMDIEQQLDIKQLLADAGFKKSDLRDDGLQLPELEDDSPFPSARTPKGAPPGPVPRPQVQPPRPPAVAPSKSATSIPPTRTSSSTRAVSSRTQPSTAPARPATTTPLIQSRPASTSFPSSSRVPPPAIVVAPGQTRTSALRAAKAAASAAAAAAAGTGASAPKTNPGVGRRPAASASSNSNINTTAAGTQAKAKANRQAQAPAQVQVQVQVQVQGRARTIARSVTSGAVPANAKVNAGTGTGTGTGTGVSAGTGAGAGLRSRSATLAAANANASANTLGKARVPLNGPSGVMRPGARGGKADGRANEDGKADGDPDELATALEKAHAHAHAVAGDGEPDFVFDV